MKDKFGNELPLMGFTIYVYRSATMGDCSLRGISSKCDQITLVGPNVPRHTPPTFSAPAFRVVTNRSYPEYKSLVPYHIEGDGTGSYMASGNFAHACDSRFEEICGAHGRPIAIHDRCESALIRNRDRARMYEMYKDTVPADGKVRTAWSVDDYNAAVAEFNRFLPVTPGSVETQGDKP